MEIIELEIVAAEFNKIVVQSNHPIRPSKWEWSKRFGETYSRFTLVSSMIFVPADEAVNILWYLPTNNHDLRLSRALPNIRL